MNLAQLLGTQGFFNTFNTEWIHKRMVTVSAQNTNCFIFLVSRGDPGHELDQGVWKIRFDMCIPDGLPPEYGDNCSMGEDDLALQKLSTALENLLRSSIATADGGKDSFPAITCIITDCFTNVWYLHLVRFLIESIEEE